MPTPSLTVKGAQTVVCSWPVTVIRGSDVLADDLPDDDDGGGGTAAGMVMILGLETMRTQARVIISARGRGTETLHLAG